MTAAPPPETETATSSEPAAGSRFGGCRIVRRIGGAVFEAVQESMQRPVAVKLLDAALARDAVGLARLERACAPLARLARLAHPGIVAVHDRGVDGGRPFLVLELVLGPSGAPESLEAELARGPLVPERARELAGLLAEALAAVHAAGVAHGGLEPACLLASSASGLKLAGVGTAALRPATAAVAGAYLAPELRADARAADARADVYAFGALAYRMLTGELPEGAFERPSELAPGLDARWDAIVERCLRRAPERRYPDARALAADIRALGATRPATATGGEPAERAPLEAPARPSGPVIRILPVGGDDGAPPARESQRRRAEATPRAAASEPSRAAARPVEAPARSSGRARSAGATPARLDAERGPTGRAASSSGRGRAWAVIAVLALAAAAGARALRPPPDPAAAEAARGVARRAGLLDTAHAAASDERWAAACDAIAEAARDEPATSRSLVDGELVRLEATLRSKLDDGALVTVADALGAVEAHFGGSPVAAELRRLFRERAIATGDHLRDGGKLGEALAAYSLAARGDADPLPRSRRDGALVELGAAEEAAEASGDLAAARGLARALAAAEPREVGRIDRVKALAELADDVKRAEAAASDGDWEAARQAANRGIALDVPDAKKEPCRRVLDRAAIALAPPAPPPGAPEPSAALAQPAAGDAPAEEADDTRARLIGVWMDEARTSVLDFHESGQVYMTLLDEHRRVWRFVAAFTATAGSVKLSGRRDKGTLTLTAKLEANWLILTNEQSERIVLFRQK